LLIDAAPPRVALPQRCFNLISDMQTLQGVLKQIEYEYKKTLVVSNIRSTDGMALTSDRCLYDTTATCRNIGALVGGIRSSRASWIRGPWEESNVKELRMKLEGNKNT
jgi:hypothetical protein